MRVFENQTYREVWGIPTMTVLTVTTSADRMNTMSDTLDRLAESRMAARFLFKTKPEFGKYWIVPPVMADLVTVPWNRTSTPLDICRP